MTRRSGSASKASVLLQSLDARPATISSRFLRLRCSLSVQDRTCAVCGHALVFSGWDLAERLTTHLPKKVQSRLLRTLSLRSGEIFTIGGSETERHFEVEGDRM